MLKNKIWLGIVLSIILILSFTTILAVDYKFTEESGAGFYMSEDDHCDALENWNEQRQIMQDLGTLLGHSKLDGTYPKDGITGGYLGRLNYGLDASKPAVPVVNDMYLATDTTKVYKCFVAGSWIQVYPLTIENNVTKTGAFTAGKIAKINNASGIIEEGTNTDTDVADAVTKKHTSGSETLAGDVSGTVGANTVDKIKGHTVDETAIANDKILVYKTTGDKYVYEIRDLSLYYLKTEIDTLSEVETIWGVTLATDIELAALKFTDLDDTPANYTGQAGKYIKVNVGETALEFGTPTGGAGTYLELTDTPEAYDNGKYAKSTAAGVIWDTPAGAGDMLKATYDSDEDGNIDVAAGGTEKSLWTLYCIPYLSGTTAFGEIPIGTAEYALTVNAGANGYDWTKFVTPQLSEDIDLNEHSIRVDATLSSDGDYSAIKKDLVTMGENVVYGQLVYKKWSDGEWYLAKADAATTAPALGIALETKGDGEVCLILREGYIRDDDWNFTAWMVYLSDITAGGVLSTAPDTAGDQVQRVGDAKTANILYFCPSIDVGEI